ncbi:MAG: anaerobic ribonucleoside-triphosphate reductase activating protein [Deltaproteobacteria bacterium]|nr:anaerobic ribonucleoside-triphosphate reductase activating protein [Deltaproteobacteria bacterium]
MIIGGLHKNSLIDYPGKISCVIFLSGCNFDCPYCHNPELAKGRSLSTGYLSEDLIFDFLGSRKGFLDGVVVSGGEPTLQKGLISFCEKIRLIGYPVKLDTNGSRPEVIKKLINEDLVNYIAMDIKTDPSHYAPLIKDDCSTNDIFLSAHIIKESNIDYEFRTTCIKSLVNKSTMENMSCLIKDSKLYVLQQYNKTDVLHPEFFKDNSNIYQDDELLELKSLANQWVNKCIIR